MAQLLHELREPDWRDLKEPDLKNKFWPDSTKIIKKSCRVGRSRQPSESMFLFVLSPFYSKFMSQQNKNELD
jgi:hypothetical protein